MLALAGNPPFLGLVVRRHSVHAIDRHHIERGFALGELKTDLLIESGWDIRPAARIARAGSARRRPSIGGGKMERHRRAVCELVFEIVKPCESSLVHDSGGRQSVRCRRLQIDLQGFHQERDRNRLAGSALKTVGPLGCLTVLGVPTIQSQQIAPLEAVK